MTSGRICCFEVASLWKSSSCSKRQLPAGRWQPSGWYLCRPWSPIPMISLRCVKGVALAQKLHHQVQSSRLPCAWLNRNRWDKNWDEEIWPCFLHIAIRKAHWSWIQGVLTLFQQKGQETIWGRSLSDPPESCVRHSNLVASPGCGFHFGRIQLVGSPNCNRSCWLSIICSNHPD